MCSSNSGLAKLDNFCIQTIQALSRMERTRQTGPLSIDSVARLDIGLIMGNDQTPQYYVNEISRFPCSLMGHLSLQTTNIELIATSVAQGLLEAYNHHLTMYPLLSRRLDVLST